MLLGRFGIRRCCGRVLANPIGGCQAARAWGQAAQAACILRAMGVAWSVWCAARAGAVFGRLETCDSQQAQEIWQCTGQVVWG